MINKTEINLNLIPESGEIFNFSASDISLIKLFKNIVIFHENNSIQIKVTPIKENTYFKVRAAINVKRPMNCSRCGQGFKSYFKENIKEYLSLEKNEDQEFLLINSSKWIWPEFIVETIELDTPYQTYKYGENCLVSCSHYDEAIKKGWITKKQNNLNPFQTLRKLRNKLN